MDKLTKSEKHESIFTTIGRLRFAIKAGDKLRALALLEKVTENASDMDIKIWKIKDNEVIEN